MADELTKKQIQQLSRAISSRVWEKIAVADLELKPDEITNLKDIHRENVTSISNDIIELWARKPQNKKNQKKVS